MTIMSTFDANPRKVTCNNTTVKGNNLTSKSNIHDRDFQKS